MTNPKESPNTERRLEFPLDSETPDFDQIESLYPHVGKYLKDEHYTLEGNPSVSYTDADGYDYWVNCRPPKQDGFPIIQLYGNNTGENPKTHNSVIFSNRIKVIGPTPFNIMIFENTPEGLEAAKERMKQVIRSTDYIDENDPDVIAGSEMLKELE